MDDTTGSLEFARSICSHCWYENAVVTYNINGRCDKCNGTDWIDAGITSDGTAVPLQNDDLSMYDIPDDQISAKEYALSEVERIRNKPSHTRFLNAKGFFKDGKG